MHYFSSFLYLLLDLNGIGADFLIELVNLSELPFNFSRLEFVELTLGDSSDFLLWILLLFCFTTGGRLGFLDFTLKIQKKNINKVHKKILSTVFRYEISWKNKNLTFSSDALLAGGVEVVFEVVMIFTKLSWERNNFC